MTSGANTSGQHDVLDRRRAGVLLHPTSLPSGDFGADAWRLVDWLASLGASVWQMLPLGPTHADASPYHALSVHAINPVLLSHAELARAGWIAEDEVNATRGAVLAVAQARCVPAQAHGHDAYRTFCAQQAHWLNDYALFRALRREHHDQPWWQWPAAHRDRDPEALTAAHRAQQHRIELFCVEQFLLAQQFAALRAHARDRGVLLLGDIPIFVAHDSADVWTRRDHFKLDESGQPKVVAGVPPDYFSATGQRWGNPLYDWGRMAQDGFLWWRQRLATELARFDLVRIDHFRGFEACWEIPAHEATAANGSWVKVPGAELFNALQREFGSLPLVAENLGIITPEVESLRSHFGFPGMLVMQFAFDSDAANPYLPHNHVPQAVVYTGTHDNNTTLGWYESLDESRRKRISDYLGTSDPMPWGLLRAALASVARLAIVPMQDVLGLGAEHRMNTPGVVDGNWRWRFGWDMVTEDHRAQFREWVVRYGRATGN